MVYPESSKHINIKLDTGFDVPEMNCLSDEAINYLIF
jgi:hypothetical protein